MTPPPPKLRSVPNKMSTNWNDLVKNIAVLNGDGDRSQDYKDLCAGALLVHLWSLAEHRLAPSTDDTQRLRDLIKTYDPEAYESIVKPAVKAKYEAEKDRITAEADALKATAAAAAETGATDDEEDDDDGWEEVYNSSDLRNGTHRTYEGQPGTFYQTYGGGGGEGGYGGYWMRYDDSVFSVAGNKFTFKDGWTLFVRRQDSMKGEVAGVRLVRKGCCCGLYQTCGKCKKFQTR